MATRSRRLVPLALVVCILATSTVPAASQARSSWPAGRWIASGDFGRGDNETLSALHTEGFFELLLIVADDGEVLEGGIVRLRGARVEEDPIEHVAVTLSFRGDNLFPAGSAGSVIATGQMRIAGDVLTEVTGEGLLPVPVDVDGAVSVGLVPGDASCASVDGVLVADFAAQAKAPVGAIIPFFAVPELVGQDLYGQIVDVAAGIGDDIRAGSPVNVLSLQLLILLLDQLNASVARAGNCDSDLGEVGPGGSTHAWLETILLDALRTLLALADQVSTADLIAAFHSGIRSGALSMAAQDPAAAAELFAGFDTTFAARVDAAKVADDALALGSLEIVASQFHLPQTSAALA